MSTTENGSVQQENKPFDKLAYLQNQIKYLGFGEGTEINQRLKEGIESGNDHFKFNVKSDKGSWGNKVEHTLNFVNKGEKTFFNSFDTKLETTKGEIRESNFRTNSPINFTAKQSINLLEGRAVKVEYTPKNATEKTDAFVKLKMDEKNKYGGHNLEFYNKEYGADLDKIIEAGSFIYDRPEYKDNLKKSLERGNIAPAKFEHGGKEYEGKVIFNPQYKFIQLYDKDMNRLNTNKQEKGLDVDNNSKSNARQASNKRSL